MSDTLHYSDKASDADLVSFSIEGDRDAFSILVTRYQNLACSVALGICGDPAQSEDLAQEAFVTAWKKRSTLKEPASFKSWLCGIVRNLALKSTRKSRREIQMRDELAHNESKASGLVLGDDEKEILWKTLDSIDEKYREPLILFYREEQSISAVADQLDLSEDVVKTRLSRGRRMVKGRVEKLVEELLVMTRPGPTFTLAVMGALPAVLATSASAATVAAGAGKGAVAVGSGAVLGALGGMMGGYLGYRLGAATARYPEQRVIMRKSFIGSLILTIVYVAPFFVLPRFGVDLSNSLMSLGWSLGFVALLLGWNWKMGKESRAVAREGSSEDREELKKTKLRQFLGKWEGRRWESKTCFLGWPIISIAFGDPDRDFSGYTPDRAGLEPHKLRTAKGWIAVGDRAYGLIAIGNIAIGGVALGSLTLGVVSFGGIAAGGIALGGLSVAVLSFGGLALGLGAIGGLSAGWWSFGGAAFGWESAKGGQAIARDFAAGGYARAAEVNTELAKSYFESHWFYDVGEVYLGLMMSPIVIPVFVGGVFALNAAILGIGFKRKQ